MDITTKIEFISKFVRNFNNEAENYEEFFVFNDLGVPLAIMAHNDMVTLKDVGVDIINETYTSLCETIGVKDDKDFSDFKEFIKKSIIKVDLERLA
jgi:hypothetical protein